MKKRILSLLLAFALAASLLVFPASAAEVVDSGTCGANLTWTLDNYGLLTISGTGAMYDYDLFKSPFYNTSIVSIIIPFGVTSIGNHAFEYCKSLTSVVIPDSISRIGNNAFWDCFKLNDVTIPDSVTYIGYSAFEACFSLTNVTISDSVTSIEDSVFRNCSSLTNVRIPDGVTSIGKRAFSECSSLTNVRIPDGVARIEEFTFSDCSSLTNVTIPDSVTTIGNNAFRFCSKLTSAVLPDNVTSIEDSAFIGCSSLTSFEIPDSVISIGKTAYMNCSSLTSVVIGDSVASIGDSAFKDCSNLNSVVIPEGITNLGQNAFENCSSLNSVVIPDSITDIKWYVFRGCSNLTNVVIPDGVNRIGYCAFQNCSSLKSVMIPDSVTSIENSAFDGCSNLTDVYFGGSQAQWNSISIAGNNDPLLNATIHFTTPELTITQQPVDVTAAVGDSAVFSVSATGADLTYQWQYKNPATGNWKNSSSATKGYNTDTLQVQATAARNGYQYRCVITDASGNKATSDAATLTVLPEGVITGTCGERVTWTLTSDGLLTISGVGPMADYEREESPFYANTSIISVVVEAGVTSIGDSAFYNCSSLKSVTIPGSVTWIGDSAFDYCSSLTSVEIPDGVTGIGRFAFSDCSSLTSVTIPDSVTSIGRLAFFGCSNLNGVVVPASVTSIEDFAFERCSSMTEIKVDQDNASYKSDHGVLLNKAGTELICCPAGKTGSYVIPDSVTSISYGAFEKCSSLTSVTIPDSVTSIGSNAFYNCSSLTSVVIPDGVTSIGDNTFRYCSSLESVVIPDSVSSIGEFAFCDCSSLTSVTIPDGVTSIKKATFNSCSSMTSVTIPDSVTSIGFAAFAGCESLKDVYYSGSSTQWAAVSIEDGNYYLEITTIHFGTSTPGKVESNPADVTAMTGETVSFSVTVSGDIASYQWQYRNPATGNWKNSSAKTVGYNTDTLTVEATAARNGYQYRCVITDASGNKATSDAATLTVKTPSLKIVQQPEDYAGSYKDWAEFFCVAEGEDVSYYWQYSTDGGETWNDSDGVDTRAECYIISKTKGRLYRCTVSDKYGNEQVSNIARVIMNASVITQPKSVSANAGETASFKVKADANEQLTYQWQYKTPSGAWKNSSSATKGYNTDTLQVQATAARNGYQYRCVVTDAGGNKATSDAATLTVKSGPVITTQPADQSVVSTAKGTFKVTATGTGLTYQWQYKNSSGVWKNCSSATKGYNTATLTVAGVSGTTNRNGYQYRCIVTDASGNTVTSNPATLTVFAIKTQPSNVTAAKSSMATFKVAATGSNLTYQWQYKNPATGNWKNCSSVTNGYNTATLNVVATAARNGYQYRCIVTGGIDKIISKAATLTVK